MKTRKRHCKRRRSPTEQVNACVLSEKELKGTDIHLAGNMYQSSFNPALFDLSLYQRFQTPTRPLRAPPLTLQCAIDISVPFVRRHSLHPHITSSRALIPVLALLHLCQSSLFPALSFPPRLDCVITSVLPRALSHDSSHTHYCNDQCTNLYPTNSACHFQSRRKARPPSRLPMTLRLASL